MTPVAPSREYWRLRETAKRFAVSKANIANDPEAATEVAADWAVPLAPLDVTMSNVLEKSHRQKLLSAGHPGPQALGDMLGRYFRLYESQLDRACSRCTTPCGGSRGGRRQRGGGPGGDGRRRLHRRSGRGQTVCELRGRYMDYPEQPGACFRVVLEPDGNFAPHPMELLQGFAAAGAGRR